uniref:Transcriptional corepressor LEUNIG isoform X2 n=1 Tax=Rhizophora mucronata TaxID=61149 RepID=A0A2P2LFT5_RHIMU
MVHLEVQEIFSMFKIGISNFLCLPRLTCISRIFFIELLCYVCPIILYATGHKE